MGAALVPIAIASAVIGTGVSVAGAISSAHAQSANASYQAQIARNNAVTAEQNAQYATRAGAAQAQAKSMEGRAKLGRILAAQAANGIDVNSGSAVDVRTGEAQTSRLDTETTAHNALLTAYGYRTQGTSDTAQAGLLDAESRQAKAAGGLGAASSLLSGASSIGFKWAGLQNPSSDEED